MFFSAILVPFVPCWEAVVCQVPRERGSAENLWEGSWLPDRLWRDLIGVQEAAWSLGEHTPPSQRHCSPTGECFLTAVMPCSQIAAWHRPALWSRGPPGVGVLSYSKHPETGTGKGISRQFLACAPSTSGCSQFWAVLWLTAFLTPVPPRDLNWGAFSPPGRT